MVIIDTNIKKTYGFDNSNLQIDFNIQRDVGIYYLKIYKLTSSTSATDVQVRLDDNDINCFFQDDEGNQINYCYFNDENKIWVKISYNQSKTFYQFLCNTDYSDMDNTFIFADDFEGSSLDTSKWYVYQDSGFYYSVSNSEVYLYSSGDVTGNVYIRTNTSFPNTVMGYRTTEWAWRHDTTYDGRCPECGYYFFSSDTNFTREYVLVDYYNYAANENWKRRFILNSVYNTASVYTLTKSKRAIRSYFTTEWTWDFIWYTDLENLDTYYTHTGITTHTTNLTIRAFQWWGVSAYNIHLYVDWIRVRNSVDTPTITLIGGRRI